MKKRFGKNAFTDNIIAKTLISVIVIMAITFFLVCLLSCDFQVNLFIVIFLLAAATVGICFILDRFLVNPLYKLNKALDLVDFNRDVVDFSEVDMLEETGFREIKFLIQKYKYLLEVISERIDRYNKENYKGEHDALTGLYNRTHLDRVKMRYETQKNVFVIFFDVNNLKRMNDQFGHEAGDALLRSAASELKYWESFGDVYRLGGDEFMVVLVNKRKDFCWNLLNKWYPQVGVLNRVSDGFKCVLAYGVATGVKDCTFELLVKEADEAMYNMKVNLKHEFGEELR